LATYLSSARIKTAIERLGDTRAKRTPLFDFLIVKRTLAVKAAPSVAIAESEPAFLEALEEIGATNLGDQEHYYLNPFALREVGKTGYRPERYRSNGTNSTISGTTWQSVIALTTGKPRRASLRPGYETELPKLALTTGARKHLPNLTEAAVWYWRGKDLDAALASAADDTARMTALCDRFVANVGLTPAEIDAVFDRAVDLAGSPENPVFVAEPPAPADYLPVKALVPGETKEENLSEVSFDLVVALAAKNFVILTGPSGTGKSRAALKLAEGLQRHYTGKVEGSIFELITVGPDWTSPKRLLGFRTPFGKERKLSDGTSTHETYEITDTVRLILRASHPDAADIPHFLIFDEMNLSHVERYFAPFLSLMEAAGILDAENGLSLIGSDDLSLISAVLQDEGTRESASAKAMIAEGRGSILPPNLFFVGTVNVDETTSMFSPKVLDRAHVIDLSSERPSAYLRAATRTEPGGTITISQADEVLKRGIEDREMQRYSVSNPASILDDLVKVGFTAAEIEQMRGLVITALDGCYDLLGPVGFPFGYRIAKEVFVYLTSWVETRIVTGQDKAEILTVWHEGLDKAFLQKVLPKIHGNRRSLGESLGAASAFLAGNDSTSNPSASYVLGAGPKVGIEPANKLVVPHGASQFVLSRRKLDDMQGRLNATGYVSFVS